MTLPTQDEALLSRAHFSRLRQYWQCRDQGLSHLGDIVGLDLVARGYLELFHSHGRDKLVITQAGIEALHAETQREKTRRQPHHDFAARLAQWLRDSGRTTWLNIEFSVGSTTDGSRRLVRPDVFSMATTYDPKRVNPAVHEVKVSRADFLADMAKPEKRGAYADISEVLYYAAPVGIIRGDELPPEIGLVAEGEAGEFSIVKRAKKRKVSLAPNHYLNLVFKHGVTPREK